MNKLHIALSALLLLASSCQSKQTDILARFDKSSPIRATKLNVDTYKLNSFGRMVLFEEQKCIVKENWIGESLLDIIYYEEDSVRSFVKKGNGPDEYVWAQVMQTMDDSMVRFADTQKNLIVTKDLSGHTVEVIKMSELPFSAVHINNEYITAGVPNKEDVEVKRYSRWNSSGQLLESFGELPPDNNPSSNKGKLFAYQGKMIVNAAEKRFVSASSSGSIFELYQTGNGTPFLLKQYHDTYPVYTDDSHGNITGVRHGKENLMGFTDLCSTNKYIYALYSGKKIVGTLTNESLARAKRSPKILVFDWDGNCVCVLLSDVELFNICVSDDDKKLIALGWNEDYQLYSFDLSGLVKNETAILAKKNSAISFTKHCHFSQKALPF